MPHRSHQPRRAPRARRDVTLGAATALLALATLVLPTLAALTQHADDRPGPVASRRSRTDIPRDVPAVAPVVAPVVGPVVAPGPVGPTRSGSAVTAADGQAVRHLTWPLPASCEDGGEGASGARRAARLPSGTGYTDDPASLGQGARLRRVYAVRAGRLQALDGAGPADGCDRWRWEVLRSGIPAAHLAALDQVVLYDYPPEVLQDPSRQGGVRTGFFEPNPADPRRYRLALATVLAPSEQLLTMAHEVGHVVSLYPDRTHPSRDPRCPWVIDDAGTCADPSSPLVAFYAGTYTPAQRSRISGLYADRRPSPEELRSFHATAPEAFVSTYAASHPTEDFAESYAYWCLYGTSRTAPVEGASTAGMAKRAFLEAEARAGRLDPGVCGPWRGLVTRG
ncbi:putative zinc-binding metallopeptidase [Arsenicicoccus cauae]|uniref:putative zinc-binding metallopeptidase n=2 Tax=Arsenicicoccus TaxID=267408 RepID=UPI00370D3EDB